MENLLVREVTHSVRFDGLPATSIMQNRGGVAQVVRAWDS